jgi:hypothetical protein
MTSLGRSIGAALHGAAAGAAGTTALNAVTYLDMVVRGRPESRTPTETVEKLSTLSHIPIPGRDDQRNNRVAGLGPLLGLVAGTGTGAVMGLALGAGWRPRSGLTFLVATTAALLVGNGPMTLLGVTDPRSWSRVDWSADIVPHLAYGAVTAYVLQRLEAGQRD